MREMPWLKIITSGAVWAIIIANFCNDWALYTYLTSIPTFYKEVLFFDIESVSSVLVFLDLHYVFLSLISIIQALCTYSETLFVSLTFTMVFNYTAHNMLFKF